MTELSGAIIKGEIIVAGERRPLGSQIPAGGTLAASLTVRNTTDFPIQMGVYWQLLDPSAPWPYGAVRQEYNSPLAEVLSGSSRVFDGPALTVEIEGNWVIFAELWGKVPGGEWELLDTIQETLCVVGEVALAGCALPAVVFALSLAAVAVSAFALSGA